MVPNFLARFGFWLAGIFAILIRDCGLEIGFSVLKSSGDFWDFGFRKYLVQPFGVAGLILGSVY